MTPPPVEKSITIAAGPDAAFRRFTTEIATWWPLRTHSVGQADAERWVFEERVGGRIYEVIRGGRESVWGIVTAWEPPRRVAFTWYPDRTPETAQQVEVRFVPQGKRTRVELTHSGWERYGAQARRAHRGYRLGWAYVLRLYAGRRLSPLVLALDAVMWVALRLAPRGRQAPSTSEAG